MSLDEFAQRLADELLAAIPNRHLSSLFDHLYRACQQPNPRLPSEPTLRILIKIEAHLRV